MVDIAGKQAQQRDGKGRVILVQPCYLSGALVIGYRNHPVP